MFQHTGRYIKRRPMKEMMMFKRSVIAMACIFPLSACGGGGGGSPDVKSADTPSKPAAPVVAENAGEGVLPKERKMRRQRAVRRKPIRRTQPPEKAAKIWRQFRQKIQAMAVRQQRTTPKMKTRGRKMICRKMPPNPQIKQGTTNPPVLQIPPPRQTLPLRMAVAILEGRTWAILL